MDMPMDDYALILPFRKAFPLLFAQNEGHKEHLLAPLSLPA